MPARFCILWRVWRISLSYTPAVQNDELRAAEAHIARLEEELLRLKDVKRDLQSLRAEHQRLRRSTEGRVAKILSAPFRLFRSRKQAKCAEPDEYARWSARQRVSAAELAKLREQSRSFEYRPLVSILTPTFNPDEKFLTEAVESVVAQAYENWELILVDDGSSKSDARTLLEKLRQRDARIQIGFQDHAGISSALNAALSRVSGDWIALLDHDDLLEPDALFRALELLQTDREADVIYSDEDKIVGGTFAAPLLKPDWSPEFFYTHDYLGHFIVMRRELACLRFRSEFDGAQDYDLLLRAREKTERIRHLPRVLYHWRRTAESTAHNIRRKPGALEAGRRAIEEHLVAQQENARVAIDWETHLYHVRYQIRSEKISIVINGANDTDNERIRSRTDFPNFEIVADLKEANGRYVLFLDSDLEPMNATWLTAIVEQLSNPKVGVVGGRIISLDDKVESAGLVLFPNGSVHSAFAGCARDFRGGNRQLQAVRNYSAVSGSCLLTRRELLETIAFRSATESLGSSRGGGIAWDNSDCEAVAFCLGLHEQGWRTVSIPYAELRRTVKSQKWSVACPDLLKRWPKMFQRDPYYNPNLSSDRADFSLGKE
jgi:glycosyltransferase involved in cell wall biosynthesis